MSAWLSFLAKALPAARANAAWPDLRLAARFLALAGQGTPSDVGLLPYEEWARIKADHTIAKSEAHNAARAAWRELPAPRLGDLDVALRSDDKDGRRVHAVLDKIEANGTMVRLSTDITVNKSVDLFELLFPATALPIELALVRILAAKGVREVERIARGAVDACAVVDEDIVPRAFEMLTRQPGTSAGTGADPGAGARPRPGTSPGTGPDAIGTSDAARSVARASGPAMSDPMCALSLSYETCALDVTAGDNDPFPHRRDVLADLTRAHLDGRTLPHRVFRDRKFVATAPAAAMLATYTRAEGTKNVIYRVEP